MNADTVWANLVEYFTSKSIQIKTIEKASGVIYAERSHVSENTADCGQVPLALELNRLLSLNVFVRAIASRTQVTVNAEYGIVRSFDGKTWSDKCYSTGELERSILDSLSDS